MPHTGGKPRRRKGKNWRKKFVRDNTKTRLQGIPKMGDPNNNNNYVNKPTEDDSDDLGVNLLKEGDDHRVQDEMTSEKKLCASSDHGKVDKKRPLSGSPSGVSPEGKKLNSGGVIFGDGRESKDSPPEEHNGGYINILDRDSTAKKPLGVAPPETVGEFMDRAVNGNASGASSDVNARGFWGRWYDRMIGGSPPSLPDGSVKTGYAKDSDFLSSNILDDDDDKESDEEDNIEDGLEQDELGMARVMKKVMRGEHRRLEKRISKFEQRLGRNMKEQSMKTFGMFVEYMRENYDAMEAAVEKRLEEKFQKKYDSKILEYEEKVQALEESMKTMTTRPTASEEDMKKVRNEILEGLDRSHSVAKCLDNMVKVRLERKVKSGEIGGVGAQAVNELKRDMTDVKSKVKHMQRDIDILNPDPFAQEHLCVVCAGVEYTEGEDAFDVACNILREINRILHEQGDEYQCDQLNIIAAKRLGKVTQRCPLLKIAVGSQEQKVAVLKAKRVLQYSDEYYRVRIRSTKSEATRAMEENMLLIRDSVPELQEYRLNGNSRLVSRDSSRFQNRGGNSRRAGRDRRGRVGGRGGRGRGSQSRSVDSGRHYDSDTEVSRVEPRQQRGTSLQRGRRGRGGRSGRGSGGRGGDMHRRDDEWGDSRAANWTESDARYDREFPRMNVE